MSDRKKVIKHQIRKRRRHGYCKLIIFGVTLAGICYLFVKLPESVEVVPIDKIYDIDDMSSSYYEVICKSIFGFTYKANNSCIDVKYDVDDCYEVTASVLGVKDTIKIHPIQRVDIQAEYTKSLYEGDVLDESAIHCYAIFEDGAKKDMDFDCDVPDDEVWQSMCIWLKTEKNIRRSLIIEPIKVKSVVSSYSSTLYEGDMFDIDNLTLYIEFKDGFKRMLDDFTWNGKTSFKVGSKLSKKISTKYGDFKVNISVVNVDRIQVDCSNSFYEGDVIDISSIRVNKVFADDKIENINKSDCDMSQIKYAAKNMSVSISTPFGVGLFQPNVIGIIGIDVSLQDFVITEGDILTPLGFTLSFEDGSTRFISVSDVVLSDEWQYPVQAGMQGYDIQYHGVTYTCYVSAFANSMDNSDLSDTDDIIDSSDIDIAH